MAYVPLIKEWELYFERKDGYENRFVVAKAFMDFWRNTKASTLEIPGKCMLGGKVFGCDNYNDGDEIFTSNIKTISKIEEGVLCANTISGRKYYFYSNGYNLYMFLMLGDLISSGRLNPRRWYYLKKEFHSKPLI